ncbi:MAG: hypothetical protein IT446_16075 [Phycisphaerales bacterium]|nr:hypothetical protein [Phycisphaerales bacterium]
MNRTRWIWMAGPQVDRPNRYVNFRRVFDVKDKPELAELRISADSNFVAWLNGKFLGTGQFTDFPDARTFSRIDLKPHLHAGQNVLALLVYHCGVDHFSYLPGEAGVWYELLTDGRIVAASDEQTICRPSPAYRPERTARITPQRGFTFHFQANQEDDWREIDYRAGADWRPSVFGASDALPVARPVPMLALASLRSGSIIAQGLLKRSGTEDQALAERMQHDYLSARPSWELFEDRPPISSPALFPVRINPDRLRDADGAYLVIDLGCEECGFISLELSADNGCTIDIAVGEHLDDLRVRSLVGDRHFACRYVARSGRQTFTHHIDRYAGRFIQLHLTGLTGPVELIDAGLVPADFPVDLTGQMNSSDSLHDRIWEISRRTLHLCMHEHYEDCPWREQALYANDSRNQMLGGYYAFGNYDFARASLDLLGRSVKPDGYLELCAPMKYEMTIPGFTFCWLLGMNDYLMYSGDRDFIAKMMPQMKRMIQTFLSTRIDGLFPCPTGRRYWQFYDWAAGLDGTDPATYRQLHLQRTRFDAPLNCLLIMALGAVSNMAGYVGQADVADECLHGAQSLRSAAGPAFWDDSHQAYRTYLGDQAPDHFAELTQALALLAGLDGAPPRSLRQKLMEADNGWVAVTLSQSLYKYEALLMEAANGRFVLDDIARVWSAMVYGGATTFWETRAGGWDFHHAGSLCHGWSAIPAYFYGAYGLGIKPLEPGMKKLRLGPCFPFHEIKGTLPTPAGRVTLHLRPGQIRWDGPAGVEMAADPSLGSVVRG